MLQVFLEKNGRKLLGQTGLITTRIATAEKREMLLKQVGLTQNSF